MSDEQKKESSAPVAVPAKFKPLVGEIEKMSIVELAELVKVLEEKFGVSAAAPVSVMAGPAAGAPAEEKTAFGVALKEVGAQKIEVIKVVRDITAKGLKESKDLVAAVASGPQIVKEGVKKEEAEEIKKIFEAAGAKVEVK
ncbi:MAG: 50S ribosomal protein L7/L12 [Patescibacteria group bacterium]